MAAGNRKERRAKDSKANAKSTGTAFQPSNELDQDAVEMILKHPDYSGPKGKTLFQLAEERQKELDKAKATAGNVSGPNTPARDAPIDGEPAIGPLGDAILYSTSMAALHLTLDVIVYSQYREDILWGEIFMRAATATPIFVLLVYLTHVDLSYRFPILRDLTFLGGSIVAGCYLVYSGNKHGYFHVMKAAPPVGTLWIWSVVEMSLLFAALSAVSVFGYIWWNGFEFF
ncbi:Nn.00g103000.m01.CDS01 [Neocucurbitaria sp. VM-36]